jgi:histidine triad (HIT) family protein
MKTIFEKIIDREIPADIVYEDDICIAMLDIAPVKKGHVLVCSKKPYPWIEDVPDNELSHIMLVVKKLIQDMKTNLERDYVQVGVVGTEVPHFHVHLIPHLLTDKVETSHHRPIDAYVDEAEKKLYVDKIKNS